MPDKMWKSEPTSLAGFACGNSVARMHGNKDNFVKCDDTGTFLSGRVSFVTQAQNIRVSTLWTFNNAFALSIPSTLGTPIPTLQFSPPTESLQYIMSGAVQMMQLIASMGVAAAG